MLDQRYAMRHDSLAFRRLGDAYNYGNAMQTWMGSTKRKLPSNLRFEMSSKVVSNGGPVLNGIKSPEDSAAIARNFVKAFQAFNSEHGFQILAEIVDRIPKFESEIREKNQLLQKAREDLDQEKEKHADKQRESLWLYNDESARFRNERGSLMQRIDGLQEELAKKEDINRDLEQKVDEMKKSGRRLKEHYDTNTSKLKEKEVELTEMTKRFEESQIQNKKNGATLAASQKEVTNLKKMLEEAYQRNVQIAEDLEAARGQLGVFEGFSVRLVNTDPKKM